MDKNIICLNRLQG